MLDLFAIAEFLDKNVFAGFLTLPYYIQLYTNFLNSLLHTVIGVLPYY